MKKLFTILLALIIWSSLAGQNCNFTDGDTLILQWPASPDSEHVQEYVIYRTNTDGTKWSFGLPDTTKLFTGLSDTIKCEVTAKNSAGESDKSDPAWAFYISTAAPPLPSDIPLYETAAEIWAGKGTIWKGFTGVWYHLVEGTTQIRDIAFWTHRLEAGDLDSTFIYRYVDFDQTGTYLFKLSLSRWTNAECYIGIDGIDYLVGEDSVIIPIEAGTRKVTVKNKVYPMYLYDFSIAPSDLKVPGKVKWLRIEKK